jgi:hypothetical protein
MTQIATQPTATELIASSKKKYALAQARLRRGLIELALLSLQGSLDDALRSYLRLRKHPAAHADWPTLLTAFQADASPPLSEEEARDLHDMRQLWQRVVVGEACNLTEESAAAYQRFVAGLLMRYGVLVVAPDAPVPDSPLLEQLASEWSLGAWWARWRARASSTFVLLLVAVCVAGAATSLALTRPQSMEDTLSRASKQLPQLASQQPGNTATDETAIPPPDVLFPGRTAHVRRSASEGLALHARPGEAPDNPVRLILSPDSEVRLIDGPLTVDGSEWWLVRAANQEGWCPAAFLEIR